MTFPRLLAGVVAAALAVPVAPVTEALAKDKAVTVSTCTAVGETDVTLAVRHAVRTLKTKKKDRVRARFKAEFEAAPNLGYAKGMRMTITIDGTAVGSRKLRLSEDGDLEAQVSLDSQRRKGRNAYIKSGTIGPGSVVEVSVAGNPVIACTLQ